MPDVGPVPVVPVVLAPRPVPELVPVVGFVEVALVLPPRGNDRLSEVVLD